MVCSHIGVDKGATAAVDSILAILGEAGGCERLLAAEAEAPAAAPAPEPAPAPTPAPVVEAAPAPRSGPCGGPGSGRGPRGVGRSAPSANGKIKASPLAPAGR